MHEGSGSFDLTVALLNSLPRSVKIDVDLGSGFSMQKPYRKIQVGNF